MCVHVCLQLLHAALSSLLPERREETTGFRSAVFLCLFSICSFYWTQRRKKQARSWGNMLAPSCFRVTVLQIPSVWTAALIIHRISMEVGIMVLNFPLNLNTIWIRLRRSRGDAAMGPADPPQRANHPHPSRSPLLSWKRNTARTPGTTQQKG